MNHTSPEKAPVDQDDDRCFLVEVDGDAARVRWSGPSMTPEDIAAITELIRAVRKKARP